MRIARRSGVPAPGPSASVNPWDLGPPATQHGSPVASQEALRAWCHLSTGWNSRRVALTAHSPQNSDEADTTQASTDDKRHGLSTLAAHDHSRSIQRAMENRHGFTYAHEDHGGEGRPGHEFAPIYTHVAHSTAHQTPGCPSQPHAGPDRPAPSTARVEAVLPESRAARTQTQGQGSEAGHQHRGREWI